MALASSACVALMHAPARADERACREPGDTRIWWSPLSPTAGSPLRILVVSEDAREGEIQISQPGRSAEKPPTSRRGGPPFSFAAELRPASAGNLRVELVKNGEPVACRRISVAPKGFRSESARPDSPGAWKAS